MFEDGLEAALGDRRALAHLSSAVQEDHKIAGCRKLVMAAAWADAHSTVDHSDGGPLVEQLVPIGPVGCPLVAETAAAGLVLPFQTSVQGVRGWIADALNLRHRLPQLWARVVAGEVHHWKAREIAQQTARLNPVTAGMVDGQITRWVEQLPWASLLRALQAIILQVDEDAYQERDVLAAAQREVKATPSENGLRTLIARGEAGDVAMMLALYGQVAEALADEGDEDSLPVRLSKAIGVIANPARLIDLLARHHDDPDPHREPWEQVAAHQADDTDPWAEELPTAGWQTARHGNHHQPAFDDDDCWDSQTADPEANWPEESPVDDADLSWYARERDHDATEWETADDAVVASEVQHRSEIPADWSEASRRPRWRALTPTELAASRPTVVLHVHLTDQSLRAGHGVVRSPDGPITVEQLRLYLVQSDASVTVRPLIDPADTASADSYEIPLRLRRAMAIRHPRSVFPHSPSTGRMDLDHTRPWQFDGPPGQTGMGNLGPLTRSEHRAKTVGRWRSRQPEPGTYLWRSPEGWIAITTNQGTLTLGHGQWATGLWQQAAVA
ncbi:MAG TPA: HNH endonuclease signature motif containing protein [Microlunatus sp.]|nr:HNH endonuclease signature motif containing protein [Microlunatus sp.]